MSRTRLAGAAPSRPRPRTKQAFVYETLREEIMQGDVAPETRLVIDELARRLGVSTIPVREALQVLQTEGLIVNVPHVGATVAPITRESIVDVFSVLEGLETVAFRLVAERGAAGDLGIVEMLVGEMDEALAGDRHEEWALLNLRFHATVAAMPGLSMLREGTAHVLDNWRRVRRFFFSGVLMRRADQAQAEHRAMFAHTRDREFDELEAVVRLHNRGALASYLAYLDGGGTEEAPHHAARRRA
jgi:DNA-binding GntR family transcriptional regulator